MAIGKKLRWEIFRRDNFACRYCGRAAVDGAVLEVDHVNPRSRCGEDVPTNLVTACDACNSGKSDTPISAPPIADVPQEAFRRSCAERDTHGLFVEDVDDLATEVLSDFHMPEIDAFRAEARDLLVEFGDPSPSERRIHAQAAVNAKHELDSRIRRLAETAERFLEAYSSPEVWTLYNEARSRLQESNDGFEPANHLVVLEAANHFLRTEDQRLLDSLPVEQANEWLAYVDALADAHTPWRIDSRDRVRRAAHVLRLARAGRAYPGMCGSSGEHIDLCPRRAQFHFRAVSTCTECEHPNLGRPEGHLACALHAEELRAGELRCPKSNAPAELLEMKPLETGEKEPA